MSSQLPTQKRSSAILQVKEKLLMDSLSNDIQSELLLNADPGEFEDKDELKLSALLSFWRQLDGFDRTAFLCRKL